MALVLSGAVALLDDDTMVHDRLLMRRMSVIDGCLSFRARPLGRCRFLLGLIRRRSCGDGSALLSGHSLL